MSSRRGNCPCEMGRRGRIFLATLMAILSTLHKDERGVAGGG